MNIGDKIRKIRKQKNLTLEELSKKTGLSLSYISLIERGLKNPSLKALEKIAECLDISPSIFFREEDIDEKESIEVFLRANTNLDEEERKMIIQLIESLEKKKNVRGAS
ncbi:MAG: helix-turn-helix transcriptional regulator [Dictyoglomus sp.]|nr:helix-turn-helix transcriptional regulator [Dictyoglomus sp.]MCX7941486.1 helix-turn-helix transcriptional regulator [Dictyoglomaceae bacterium]MDW8189098.1 helix-turn-helix transcriptional regulator [Dictyoglomus sp.]